MKKVFPLLVLYFLIIPNMFAAGSDQQNARVSFFHYFSGPLRGGLEEMIDTVNTTTPSISVEQHALDHEAFKSMVHVLLLKEHPPEMFSYWAGAKTQALVDKDVLMPIDELWHQAGLNADFDSPVTREASIYNGKHYLLPITQHFVVFFYNTSIFKKVGITSPQTWQELQSAAEKLKENDIIPFSLGAKERWPAQFWFDYLLLRTAGQQYRNRLMTGEARYNDKEVSKAYSLWTGLLLAGYFNSDANELDWSDATRQVCKGESAMTLMGTWAIQEFTRKECGLREGEDFDFFAFPLIDETIPKTAVGPVDGLLVTKKSRNVQAAMELLNFFARPEAQKIFSKGSGAFAPSSKVPTAFYSPLKKRILAESRTAASWAFNYDLATRPEIAERGMDSFNEIIAFPDQVEAILTNLDEEVQKILSGK